MTAAAKHTPGPWLVDDECQICAGNELLATVNVRPLDANAGDWDLAFANARLFAAAPDLLAALRAVQGDRDFRVRCGDFIQGVVDAAVGKAGAG